MKRQFDERNWPELTRFRDACLENNYEEMARIAARNHHWYSNENPHDLPLEELAAIYQAQWFASENDLASLKQLIDRHPWTINRPWTAQAWLPITQAASTHGDRRMIEFLLEQGADPTLMVGGVDDSATVPEMARYGKNHALAHWLEQIVREQSA